MSSPALADDKQYARFPPPHTAVLFLSIATTVILGGHTPHQVVSIASKQPDSNHRNLHNIGIKGFGYHEVNRARDGKTDPPTRPTGLTEWLLIIVLSIISGRFFFFIKVAVSEVMPLTLSFPGWLRGHRPADRLSDRPAPTRQPAPLGCLPDHGRPEQPASLQPHHVESAAYPATSLASSECHHPHLQRGAGPFPDPEERLSLNRGPACS